MIRGIRAQAGEAILAFLSPPAGRVCFVVMGWMIRIRTCCKKNGQVRGASRSPNYGEAVGDWEGRKALLRR